MSKMKCNTVLCLHLTDGTRNRHNHQQAGTRASGQASFKLFHCSNLSGAFGSNGSGGGVHIPHTLLVASLRSHIATTRYLTEVVLYNYSHKKISRLYISNSKMS